MCSVNVIANGIPGSVSKLDGGIKTEHMYVNS